MIYEVWYVKQISGSLVSFICQKFANLCQKFGVDSDFMVELGNFAPILNNFDNPVDLLRSSFSISKSNAYTEVFNIKAIRV